MSTTLRSLRARHEAWGSFRDIAHATRALAASRRSRWSLYAQRTAQHLAWVKALSELSPPGAPAPTVLVGVGTDLGLCGRLNLLVADALARERAERAPALTVVIGERLARALEGWDGDPAVERTSAPASPTAVLSLAERLDLTLARLGLADARLAIVAAVAEEAGTPSVRCELDVPAALEDDVRAVRVQLRRERQVLSDLAAGRARVHGLLRHARLAHALSRAQVVESSIRWAVMNRAHEGAQQRLKEQELELRRLRQEEITQEMLDVVAERGLGV